MLDRGEHERDLLAGESVERAPRCKPGLPSHALLAVDRRLLPFRQLRQKEEGVEAHRHLFGRYPAREFHERVGLREHDPSLLGKLAHRRRSVGAIAVVVVDRAAGEHPHAAHEPRLLGAPDEQHSQPVSSPPRPAGSPSQPGEGAALPGLSSWPATCPMGS